MLDVSTDTLALIRPVSFQAGAAQLSGTLFLPADRPGAAVVLNGATGVPQSYYRHFAQWLAVERGMACLTYDYRDFGASQTGPMNRSDATMSDWGLIDQPAARAELRRLVPDTPLWVVGHSLGAMMMPMQEDISGIDRMIGVASGMVRHIDHPWPYQGLARLFWFGHGPLATHLAGYLPGKRLGFGADLPSGVYWEWRRWCTSRDFFLPDVGWQLPDPNWDRSKAPVDLFALSDDATCPPSCVWKLAELYGNGSVTPHLLILESFGLGQVGHLGAFARRNKVLWSTLIG